MLSQLRAHQFPVWVEQLDLREALEELRLVGAAGFAGQKAPGLSVKGVGHCDGTW